MGGKTKKSEKIISIHSEQKHSKNSKISKIYDFSKHETSHYDKHEEGFGAVIVAKSFDKVLIIATGPPEDRSWEFPKGHRNDKETPVHAAIREVKEETDVIIDDGDFVLDEKGDPIILKIEFPWQYGNDILTHHISRIIEKQKDNPTERPYWNSTKPMKKCISLYLAPVEMDRFKPKAQESDGVVIAQWASWDEAHKLMLDSKSIHITALHEAFNILKGLKRISKNKDLPVLTRPQLAAISKHIDEKKKLMIKPISQWPKEKQPKKWAETVDEIEEIHEENTEEISDAEESVENVEGGDENEKNTIAQNWNPLIYLALGMFLVAFLILIIFLVFRYGSDESIEQGMGLPMA